jgi:hypothetical protein
MASAVIAQVGDIGVTSDTILTPNGDAPLGGSTWMVMDYTRTDVRLPTWAIVVAILTFVLCLVGLLFLLVKERTVTGHIEVRVQSGSLVHLTQIPARTPQDIDTIRMQVSNIQTMARQQQG